MHRRLSILYVVAPARYGGLETVVRGLSGGHGRRGHRVRVAALTPEGTDPPHEFVASLRGSAIEAVEWRTGRRAYLAQARLVAEACRRWEPDVVHTHGYHADVVAGTSARWAGVPVVTTVHGFLGGGWKNRVYERLQRWAFRGFDAVVPVSRPLARELEAGGPPAERIHVISNAWGEQVEPVDRAEARAALGLDGAGAVIGWVGRMSREKGLDVLLEALAGLDVGAWRLAVVGDGPEAACCRARAASLDLNDRVSWLGPVEDAGRYFRAFDLFCLSSRSEGMPVVLFEAMTAGVPVVSTRVGGVEEVLSEESAWLCPAEDPEALRDRLRTALRRPDVSRAKAERARDRLREEFGPERWLDRYEELYRSLVSADPSRRGRRASAAREASS